MFSTKGEFFATRHGLNCAFFNAISTVPVQFSALMPTYEYSCTKCGQNFEAVQSMRDEPFRECPKELCWLPKWGHGKVKRLLGTGAGVIFKGSGFYSTDYRSASYKEGAKKDAPAPVGSAGDKPSGPKEATGTSSKGAGTDNVETKPKKQSAA
jgi:putative FmdB family regulatory protein